ncbi:MAG: LysR family transcriptional regulator [Acidobacteriaceae bacterium]|nr:LysR family transcriptional regulator [Acidobacteriaceae bacterium]
MKVFRAVAEHLSFRKAGEALYVSQPAVTLQIKTLEEEIGIRLFERRSSGVQLTRAGEVLLRYANELHRLSMEAESQLAALKGEVTGELVLGASTTVAQYVLPPLLSEFARTFSGIQVQVFSDNTESIAEGVAGGRFGLGLIEGPPQRRDVRIERWFDDELLLVVPVSHEWAGTAALDPSRLYDARLVMRERGSGSRHVVETGLQKAGIQLASLRIVMELDSTEAILSCIEEGLGVGFASEWALARRTRTPPSLAALRLRGASIERSFSFVSQPGPELTGAAAAVLRFLQSRVPSLPYKNR